MKLPPKLRLSRRKLARIALPIVALALIASVGLGRERPSLSPRPPAARLEARVDSRAALQQDLDLSALHRRVAEAKVDPAKDPFAKRSFEAKGPVARAPRTAPPLPFVYLGKEIEDGKLSVFLMRGNDSYSVHSKQRLDSEYRVDKVTETQVTFTYLPLKTKQTLDIPAVN